MKRGSARTWSRNSFIAVGRRVHPHPVDVELAAAGHLRQSHLVRRRLQVVVAELGDQAAELRVDSGLDGRADLVQEVVAPVADAVGGWHEQLVETTPIALEHPDHGRDLGLRQVDAAVLLPGHLVGELPDPLGVFVEQMEVVGAVLVGFDRSGAEHLVEDVQAEAAGRVGRDVEVRPVVLRRLDQHAEVPPQQPEGDPVLVVDRLLVDAGQPVEQVPGEGGVRLGGFERPVREVLDPLAAAKLEVGIAGGDEVQVLVAGGGDEVRVGGAVDGDLHAAGGEQGKDEDGGDAGPVAHDFLA